MENPEIFVRFAVAVGIGLVIGLERGWRGRDETSGQRAAGIRTFTLSGLLGGVLGLLAQQIGSGGTGAGLILGLGFATYSAALALFSREENLAEKTSSATTAVAGMVTLALGAYAVLGDIRLAAAGAVAAAIVLALREPLHGLVEQLSWRELRAGLVLLAMTFIGLPLLPDGHIGPFGGVNVRELWLIAIVLATVSFAGYAAIRIIGETQGVLLASAAGGLVSSTAVMVNNARSAATASGMPATLAAGAMIATAISLVRVLVLVMVLNRPIFEVVLMPLVAAALFSVGAALALYWRSRAKPINAKSASKGASRDAAAARLRNPFELRVVIGFTLLLGTLEMTTAALTQHFGSSGAFVTAILAGAGDVDAGVISAARLAPGILPAAQAALAVLAAVAANGALKLAVGAAIGRGLFALYVASATSLAAAAGVAGWLAAMILGIPAD